MGRKLDLTGHRFGRLTVLERSGTYCGRAAWKCLCDCGAEKIIDSAALRSGKTQSCGCLQKEMGGRNLIDLSGKRFGKLTVISRHGNDTGNNAMWLCLCSCGSLTVVRGADLRNNHTSSCGCLHRELTGEIFATHGLSGTRLYRIWAAMLQRCTNKNNIAYARYGGRGITVCDEWLHSFKAFCDWALANGYQDDLTLDRIDNNGHYCPENCRWATLTEQANNKRSNVLVEYNGVSNTIAEWSAVIGIPYIQLWRHLKTGLSLSDFFEFPQP